MTALSLSVGHRSASFASVQSPSHLRRTVSVIALATGMIGLASLATPAAADCIEDNPGEYVCSGDLQVGPVIAQDDVTAQALPGFTVDTSANGNALALSMTGAGRIAYLDLEASSLTGAGVRLSSTGSTGLDSGSTLVFSNGAIVANGANGLRLDNAGGGDTGGSWSGSIINTGGNGVLVDTEFGSGDVALQVGAVFGRDDGVRFEFGGNGELAFIATGDLVGETGTGLLIDGGTPGDAYDIQVGNVTGGAWGVWIDNQGTETTRVVSTGTVTGQGQAGMTVSSGVNTTGIDIFANQVNGETYGIQVTNSGSGATNVIASGTVAAATSTGIVAVNDVNTTNLSISTADVVGGGGVIALNYGTGVTQILSTGAVVGFTTEGVRLENATSATHAVVNVEDVSGETTGIEVLNRGTGETYVRATGSVTGDTEAAIDIETGVGSQGVVVEAVDAAGGASGIVVEHAGSAGVSVTATGAVSGGTGTGIYVETEATSTDVSIQAAAVSGGFVGIASHNDGLGSSFIGAAGPVTGGDWGILAEAGASTTGMTIEVGDVTGGNAGIDILDYGSGVTTVQSTGVVVGGAWDAIAIQTGTGSQGVVVEAFEARGDQDGIVVQNLGAGGSLVRATGEVTANFGAGIRVENSAGSTDIEIEAAAVTGGSRGISASSQGNGGIYISATGPVSGDDFGILAETAATNTDIDIRAVDVSSDGAAIVASNVGTGFTRVVTTGTVAGTDAGIRAFGGAASTGVYVEAQNASGGMSGIAAVGDGLGPVEIFTHGVIQGGDEGIEAFSANNGVTIVNDGVIRNLSGLSSDRAVDSIAAFLVVENEGTVIGGIDVLADASLFTNEGVWSNAGATSLFAGGDDAVFNMVGGTVFGGGLAGVAETTVWSGLEAFTNRGLLQMLDGGAGDQIETSGYAVFESTSTLAVDIGGPGLSDRFRVVGAVEIEPGATLTVNAAQPLVLHSQYVVIEAAGGVTGEFDFDDQLITAFAGVRDGYTATTAYVEFAQMKALAEAGLTPNQKETAEGADSLPDGNAVKDALLMLPDDATAQAAFDQLSGEIHPALRTAMVEDSRLPRNAVLDRLAADQPQRSAWGRVFGSFGTSDGDSNAAELDRDARGMVLGVDQTFGDITIGVAGGLIETEVDLGGRDSVATVESVHGLAYAGGRFGAWAVRGGIGYAVTSADTKRQIAFPGFAQQATAAYDGSLLQAFVEASYRLSLSNGAQVEPFVGLTGVQVETDAFTEAGGPASLSGRSQTEQTAISTVGLRFETDPEAAYGLRGSVGWRHSWGDLDPAGVHAFDGGASFEVLGAAQSADAAFANVEARWRVTQAATFGIAYDGVAGGDSQDHAITGSFRVVF